MFEAPAIIGTFGATLALILIGALLWHTQSA